MVTSKSSGYGFRGLVEGSVAGPLVAAPAYASLLSRIEQQFMTRPKKLSSAPALFFSTAEDDQIDF